jgi:hypothetical protein
VILSADEWAELTSVLRNSFASAGTDEAKVAAATGLLVLDLLKALHPSMLRDPELAPPADVRWGSREEV